MNSPHERRKLPSRLADSALTSSHEDAGFDYTADYTIKTDNAGRFTLATTWSMYTHYKQSSVAGSP